MSEKLGTTGSPSFQYQGQSMVRRKALSQTHLYPFLWLTLFPSFFQLALGGASSFDPFAKPLESTEPKESLDGAQALAIGKSSSPVGE